MTRQFFSSKTQYSVSPSELAFTLLTEQVQVYFYKKRYIHIIVSSVKGVITVQGLHVRLNFKDNAYANDFFSHVATSFLQSFF